MPKALKRLRRSPLPSLGTRDPAKPLYIAYIDEAGDEGFRRDAQGRLTGSQWFVLSAVLVRAADDLEVSRLVDRAKQQFGKPPTKPLHFVDLNHNQRRWLTQELAAQPVTVVSKFVDKDAVTSPTLQQFPKLYFHAVRYLLERLTWFVDDAGAQVTLVFSNRSQLPYKYLAYWLRWYCINDPNCQIRRQALSGILRTEPHWAHKLLQLADVAASGAFAACEPHRQFGFTEETYLTILLPQYYRRAGRCRSYGVSFFPNDPAAGRFNWWDGAV